MSARAAQALDTILAENRAYESLLGKIAWQCTDRTLSSGGALNEIKALLVRHGIIDQPLTCEGSGSSAAPTSHGGSPVGDGSTQAPPSPARHAAAPTASGVPGTRHYVPGDVIYPALVDPPASDLLARPVSPAGPVADWMPTTHHYGPGDLFPATDPALTESSPGPTATSDGLPGPANPPAGGAQ